MGPGHLRHGAGLGQMAESGHVQIFREGVVGHQGAGSGIDSEAEGRAARLRRQRQLVRRAACKFRLVGPGRRLCRTGSTRVETKKQGVVRANRRCLTASAGRP